MKTFLKILKLGAWMIQQFHFQIYKGNEVVAHGHTEELVFKPMPVQLVCSVPGYPHMRHICFHIYCTAIMVTNSECLTCSHILALGCWPLKGPDPPVCGLGERIPLAFSE